jgi:hypothetical protein
VLVLVVPKSLGSTVVSLLRLEELAFAMKVAYAPLVVAAPEVSKS